MNYDKITQKGLTKREYFSGLAMQAILQKEAWAERIVKEKGDNTLAKDVVRAAMICADELLSELDKIK